LDSVKPIGLAARDSLRLDMGYPLYGHDIDDTTSPVEAGIGWVIGKLNDGFIGHERILHEKQNGARQKRVGFVLTGKGVAREGAEIYSAENPDQKLGMVTSGGFSPTRKESVAMGYINKTEMKDGDRVLLRVRGRDIDAEIAPLPFVQASTKAMGKKPAAA
jgi:aminomethyltransferase